MSGTLAPWVYDPRPPRGPLLPLFLRRLGLQQPDVFRNPALYPFRWIYGRPVIHQIVQAAQGAARIADLGCGCGWLTWELARNYPQAHILAVGRDRELLEWAQRNIEERGDPARVEFDSTPLEKLELEPHSYDFIVLSFSLGSLKQPLPFLEMLHKALMPGGQIFYYEATAPTPLNLDRLAGWMHRRAAWRGQLSDRWNQRRRLQAYYEGDPVRRKRFTGSVQEADCYQWLQEHLQVVHHERRRAFVDILVETIPERRWAIYLPIYVLLDRLLVHFGYLEGCCRVALLKKS